MGEAGFFGRALSFLSRSDWGAASERLRQQTERRGAVSPFKPALPPRGVVPDGSPTLAMDANITGAAAWAGGYWGAQAWAFSEGLEFLGYPYLAELAQRAEYRRIVETTATEMTRKWVRFEGDDERVTKVQDELKRLGAPAAFKKIAEQDGFFGRSHLYLDNGYTQDPDELRAPIGDGSAAFSESKVNPRHPLRALKPVEAVWVYPTNYNSSDPLADDWYRPEMWFAMGKQVHASRLLTFIGREVPDLLKPAYSFGGLSLTQMAKPYVDNWLQTRQSVNDIVSAYSQMVLKTDMSETLQVGGDQLFKRLDLFNQTRNNRGVMAIDKDNEDFSNVSAPIAGLHELQAQAQEHMAAVSGIPLVKLLGIQPAGLNASSEGELRTFYDWIAAGQEALLRPKLDIVVRMVQLSLFGDVDPDLKYEFLPLWALDEVQQATLEKTRADMDQVRIDSGVISPEDARSALATRPDSPYPGMDPDDVPDLVDEEEQGLEPEGGRPQPVAEEAVTGRSPAKDELGYDDADWQESKHPRSSDGKFGHGGGHVKATRTAEGRHAGKEGGPLPEHIAKLSIPPAWTDVTYSESPDASLLVTGRDAKGRQQAIYSLAHEQRQAAVKFARISELSKKFTSIMKQNDEAIKSGDERTAEAASCLRLIAFMGLRPGSEADTGARQQAYGATTLEGRHVVVEDGRTYLRFIGKEGVSLNLPVVNPGLAAEMQQRARKAGVDGKLFPGLTDARLRTYVGSLGGGGFKTKDFRTHLGTHLAIETVAEMPAPRSEAEYKRAVREVAKRVSATLGNTPTIALQSYISPVVFAGWRGAIE